MEPPLREKQATVRPELKYFCPFAKWQQIVMPCRSGFLSKSRIQMCWVGYFIRVICLFKEHKTLADHHKSGYKEHTVNSLLQKHHGLDPRNRCFGILSFQGAHKTEEYLFRHIQHHFPSSIPVFEGGKPKAPTPWCGKVSGSLSLAFISVLCYTKDTQKCLNAQTKTSASAHRISLTILHAWLLLVISNFFVKNFIMGVIHNVQIINSFYHSLVFSKTIVLFIKALESSKRLSNGFLLLRDCSAWQWYIWEISREQGQAAEDLMCQFQWCVIKTIIADNANILRRLQRTYFWCAELLRVGT